MEDRFRGKFRIPSNRRANFDYSSAAIYFITICSADRQKYFGEIREGLMELNSLGIICRQILEFIPNKFSNAEIGDYVIMPNHLHCLVSLRELTNLEEKLISKQAGKGGATGKNNPMGKKSLGEIERWFKGRTAFEIRKIEPSFACQANYHDHVIRNDKALEEIERYITENPFKWSEDELYIL